MLRRMLQLVPRWSAFVGRRRRDLAVARARAWGRLHSARLQADLAPDVTFGRGVRISLVPGTRNVLRMGPGSRFDDDVVVQLRGGTIEMGPQAAARHRTRFNVAGHLTMGRNAELSYDNVVHCGERVILDELMGASERVTIADSRHFQAGEAEWFYHNVETAPVRVGRNTWLSTNVVVAAGVTIGADTIVAANSVVSRDLGDAVLAAGAPAAVIRANPTREDWLAARSGSGA